MAGCARAAAFYECLKCQNTVEVPVDRGRVEEPTRCEKCNAPRSLNHIYNRCKSADKQVIRLPETPGMCRSRSHGTASGRARLLMACARHLAHRLNARERCSDAIPDGQTPHTVTLLAYDDLVDVPRAGDRSVAPAASSHRSLAALP